MRHLDLFSGIGGISLGLERCGIETVAFCEVSDYCHRVLRKHWPHVPIYPDVRELTGERLRADGIGPIDIISGGFPCQPVSTAGQRKGESDDRWLWPQFARLIGEIGPRWVLAENVRGLLSIDSGRVFGGILRDLADIGYDAEWHVIPAASVGAPHIRERVWILAYPNRQRSQGQGLHEGSRAKGKRAPIANGPSQALPNHDRESLAVIQGQRPTPGSPGRRLPYSDDWWAAEPDVGRVAHGVPDVVDRLRGLGNACVPQVVEWIGRELL